jgi:uncharacterized protein
LDSILFIIGINVIIFIAVNIRPDLIGYLGLAPASVTSQPWTLLTSMFTHQDFMHIFFNMFTLYFFGTAVLQLLGAKRFWIIYMVGGLVGGLFYVLLQLNSPNPAIGASGAIFALGGALAVLRPNMKVVFFPIPVPMPIWIAILVTFGLSALFPGVAWQAHLGGLLFGGAAGYVFRRERF